ncbi:MAG: GAF domain-containing protein [Chroococcidiopsidaceae cyanobacterium CP_BM_ER_R8_30]|nr:GAF domain-containing protein [Chroococcidiopsidaceae cyanobacterium CP_BM_ER_R8_30]
MTPSQHLLEFNQNLQRHVAQLEQENQQLQTELVRLRQEQERLQKSEARYRQCFKNSPISTVFITNDGRLIEANLAFERKYGWTIEQLKSIGFNIFTDLQLRENGTLPYMEWALAGETAIEPPTNFYNPSKLLDNVGSYTPGQGHYFPIWNDAGAVEEIVEMSPVVTQLLEAQAELLQEKERAATERSQLLSSVAEVANLLLRSPDYTLVLPEVVRLLGEAVGSDRCSLSQIQLDPASGKHMVWVSAEWCQPGVLTTIECTPDLELGMSEDAFADLAAQILGGEIANILVADLQPPVRDVFVGQGNTSMLLVPIMMQQGCWGLISFDNCGEPRLFDEAEIAILKIAADSIAAAIERWGKDDELRHSEALYRSLFEISHEGIYRWQLAQPVSLNLPINQQVDLVYRHMYVAQANDAFASIYGLAQGEDIVGLRLSEAHAEGLEKNLTFVRTVIQNGYRIRNAESEEIDVNRQKRYFLNSVISFTENEQVTGGWGTQIEITELREAQQALLAAEQARAELLKTMTTIANRLLRASDYGLVLPDVLQLLGEAARADRCSLAQNITAPVSGKSAVRMNAEWCRPGIQASVTHTPELESALLWEDFAELYERLIQGETVQFFGTDLCASLRELFDSQGNKAMLMVPIMVQGEFWGVFGFDYCHEVRQFEELDQSIFAIAVDSIAAAIERQQQEEALLKAEQAKQAAIAREQEKAAQHRAEQFARANQVLQRTVAQLVGQDDLNQFLTHVLLEAAQEAEAANASIFLYDSQSNTLKMHQTVQDGQVVNLDTDSRFALWQTPIPADISPAWKQITQSFVIWIDTNQAQAGAWDFSISWHLQMGHQSVLCVPLLLGHEPLGFLGLCFRDPIHPGAEPIELVQTLAHQATLALQLTRLAEEAKQAAIIREKEQAAQARATEQAKINTALKQMVSALSTATDLNQFLGYMLRVIAEQFDAPVTEYWVHPDGERAYLKLSCYQGQMLTADEQPGHPGRLGYQIPQEMIHQERLNDRQHHFIVEDLRTDPVHNAISAQIGIDIGEWRYRMRGVSKLLNIPLRIAEETIGALLIFVPSDRQFTTQQIELGYALAQQISLAIRLSQLAEQAKQSAIIREQEKAAQLQVAELAKANDVLKSTLDTLATEPDLDCFLRHILSVIAQQMNAPACLLWLFDELLQTATLHLSYTDGQVNFPARFNADRAQPLCLHSQSWVFRTDQRQPYLIEVANPPFTRASCAYLTRSGVKAILVVPLWLGDQLIGSFGVRLPQVRDLAPSELELVQALGHQATLALQLMQLTEQASHSAVLEERNRMAREIHDVLAQAFTGVVVQLEAAKMIVPQDAPVKPLFAQAQDLARAGLVEARRSVWSLRPQALENTNLRSALEQLVQTLTHNTSVQIQLQIQGVDDALAPEVETHLLRIAQEALTNALTHAQASTIVIELTFGTQAVELCVRDDGQGFEPTAVRGQGFGLVSMQERAVCINGEFILTSQPGCGTIVLITVPLSPQSQAPTRRS